MGKTTQRFVLLLVMIMCLLAYGIYGFIGADTGGRAVWESDRPDPIGDWSKPLPWWRLWQSQPESVLASDWLALAQFPAHQATFPWPGPHQINPVTSPVAQLRSWSYRQPLDNAEQAQAYVAGLKQMVADLDDWQWQIESSPPALLLEAVVAQLQSLTNVKATETFLWQRLAPTAQQPWGQSQRWLQDAEHIIAQRLQPLLQRHLKELLEHRAQASNNSGLSVSPQQRGYYQNLLSWYLQRDLQARDLHFWALQQVEQLNPEARDAWSVDFPAAADMWGNQARLRYRWLGRSPMPVSERDFVQVWLQQSEYLQQPKPLAVVSDSHWLEAWQWTDAGAVINAAAVKQWPESLGLPLLWWDMAWAQQQQRWWQLSTSAKPLSWGRLSEAQAAVQQLDTWLQSQPEWYQQRQGWLNYVAAVLAVADTGLHFGHWSEQQVRGYLEQQLGYSPDEQRRTLLWMASVPGQMTVWALAWAELRGRAGPGSNLE